MKLYVVGFVFNNDMSEVVLIRKERPRWQEGKLNGVGGSREIFESHEVAMAREFCEEAGVITHVDDWFKIGLLYIDKVELAVLTMRDQRVFDMAHTKTDEAVVRCCTNIEHDVVYNVPSLIRLCANRFGKYIPPCVVVNPNELLSEFDAAFSRFRQVLDASRH